MGVTHLDLSILAALLAIAAAALLALDFMREAEMKRLRRELRESEARADSRLRLLEQGETRADSRLRLLEQDAFGDSWQRRPAKQ